MFFHNFKYTFKTLLRSKALVFWSFAFPIILATLFNMAFSNISNSEKLSVSDIAIINNEEFNNNKIYVETFKELSKKESDNQLFNIQYVNEKKAKKLLDNDKIDGYLIINDDKPQVTIKTNGINQTILKYVVEEIDSMSTIANNLIEYEIKNGN